MRTTDVINYLNDELVTVLTESGAVTLSSPSDHVGLVEGRHPPTYPYVGIRKMGSVGESMGVGNENLVVDSMSYDTNGVVKSITRRRESTLTVEIVPVTDGDAHLRDTLYDDVLDHFTLLTDTDGLPTDVETLSVEESGTEGRSKDFVHAEGIPVQVTYKRYLVESNPTAAETVNVDVDAGSADVDDNTDADAFDETF